jgi:hypothetical protein
MALIDRHDAAHNRLFGRLMRIGMDRAKGNIDRATPDNQAIIAGIDGLAVKWGNRIASVFLYTRVTILHI